MIVHKFLVEYRNPLLSLPPPPPPETLFISITFEGGRGAGLNTPGGIFEMGVLFFLAKTTVSVLPKELEYKVENHKYMHENLEVTQPCQLVNNPPWISPHQVLQS